MSLFEKNNLIELENSKTDFNLTILVSTYRANNDELNRIGLKNAIKDAEQQLENNGKDEEEIKKFLKPVKSLLDEEHFFEHQSDTLAIFINENIFKYYTLPVTTKSMTYLGTDFFFKPLLKIINADEVAHIMTVSSNRVRLLSFTNHQVMEHDISDEFPQNVEESKWHIDKSSTLQSHGSGKSLYHGHGGGKDAKEDDIKRFFRDVFTGLENFFKGEKRKVILAGVNDTVRLFRETFKYDHFMEYSISGNHDETSMLDLHAEAVAIVDDIKQSELQKEVEELSNQISSKVERSLDEIIKASNNGRIEALYIKENVIEWGYFDNETLKVEHSDEKTNGQIDLLNKSAVLTILNGGKVELVPQDVMNENTVFAKMRH